MFGCGTDLTAPVLYVPSGMFCHQSAHLACNSTALAAPADYLWVLSKSQANCWQNKRLPSSFWQRLRWGAHLLVTVNLETVAGLLRLRFYVPQYRAEVLIIFPLILQTTTIAQVMSNGGEGKRLQVDKLLESVMQWPPSKLQAPNYTAWLTELMFYVPLDTKYVILETFFPASLVA